MNKSTPQQNDFESVDDDKQYAQVDKLEQDLQHLTNKRYEERFFYVTAIILLIDGYILPDAHGLFIFFVFIIEIPIILALAQKWRVDEVVVWARWVSYQLRKLNSKQ